MKRKIVKIILVLVGLVYFPLLFTIPASDLVFGMNQQPIIIEIIKIICGVVAFIGFSVVWLEKSKL